MLAPFINVSEHQQQEGGYSCRLATKTIVSCNDYKDVLGFISSSRGNFDSQHHFQLTLLPRQTHLFHRPGTIKSIPDLSALHSIKKVVVFGGTRAQGASVVKRLQSLNSSISAPKHP
jgi:hypothetical protein